MSTYIRNDYNMALIIFGDKESLNKDLVVLYKQNLHIIAAFANEFRDSHDDSHKFRNSDDHIGGAIADIPGDWAASVKLEAYNIALHFIILKKWSIWLLPSLAIGFIAGALTRKLKADTFSPPLPPVYNTSAHILLAFSSMIILWLICPVPIPLSIIPTLSLIISFVISLAVTHYPNY